jgi:hypothetical protein
MRRLWLTLKVCGELFRRDRAAALIRKSSP